MVCPVGILPAVIGPVWMPVENTLLEICVPTNTHAVYICSSVIGIVVVVRVGCVIQIVNVGNGDRHPIPAESHILPHKHQVARVVIYIAGTRAARGRSGIIPVVFQPVTAPNHDGKDGFCNFCAIVHRVKLHILCRACVLYRIAGLKHHAGICACIPFPDDIGNYPAIHAVVFHNGKVFYICIMAGLVLPGKGT